MAAAAPQISLNTFSIAPAATQLPPLSATGTTLRSAALFDEATSECAHFDVKGQGTVAVTVTQSTLTQLDIILGPSQKLIGSGSIGITITDLSASLWAEWPSINFHRQLKVSENKKHVLDTANDNLAYWLSFDANNRRLRYGKGEMMVPNMLFEFSWTAKDDALDNICKQLDHVTVAGPDDANMHIQCLRTGVNLRPSPILRAPDQMTLDDIARNSFTVASDLPFAAFQLYNNVAGSSMTLDSPEFRDFPAAIQRSILTEGLWCHTELQKKKANFGYLRITLGGNQGNSPGQPYVMEIWPAGNGSPIHNHGNANAVIKCLHGAITVNWFAGLVTGDKQHTQQPWGSATVRKDDVTWISGQFYQIHQLHNDLAPGGEFAATIQCYRYDESDKAHYEYFDYVDPEAGQIKHFEPDSDADFVDFKAIMRAEWDAYLADQQKQKQQPQPQALARTAAAAALVAVALGDALEPPAKKARTANGALKRGLDGELANGTVAAPAA